MTMQQNTMKEKSVAKLALTSIGLSALLALSACSGGDNTAAEEPTATNDTETVVVEPETPVAETEVATPEPAVEAEPAEVPVEEPQEAPAPAEEAAEPEVLAANAGEQLYEKQCKACHATGLLGAPKFGDKADWAPHLEKDIETLHMHSAKGFNKMPPQANDNVSEAQVHAAVDYMVAAAS
ncbi:MULTISPECIES: cytochrome c5 family protein [unclassified Psychrobacter]|uniref:c-type cytochrome n=1 Tax=unclassified Psychrobacter TaxID=196806 RepID=UPI0025D7EB3F|nr:MULTISPECIES: c-type cytochrome [unclassified Psychrobacter]